MVRIRSYHMEAYPVTGGQDRRDIKGSHEDVSRPIKDLLGDSIGEKADLETLGLAEYLHVDAKSR